MVVLYVTQSSTPLGDAIRRCRERVGLTKTALAEISGVERTYISMLENGRRKNASVEIMTALAAALGMSVGALYREAGREWPNGDDDERTVKVDDPMKTPPLRRIGRFSADTIQYLLEIGEVTERRLRRLLLESVPPAESAEAKRVAEDETAYEPGEHGTDAQPERPS